MRLARFKQLAVEFLLIFVAVTLSFLADDFRSRWGERSEERTILEGIRYDIQADLPIVAAVRRLDSTAAVNAQWLHRNWERASMPQDSLAAALQSQYFGRLYNPVRAAYESAKGSGHFGYIRDGDLRLRIGSLYENKQLEERGVNQLVMNSLLDLHRELRPYLAFSDSFPPVCCASRLSVAVPWRQMQSDRVLRNTLLTSEMFRRLSAARLASFEDSLRVLADHITATLGAR